MAPDIFSTLLKQKDPAEIALKPRSYFGVNPTDDLTSLTSKLDAQRSSLEEQQQGLLGSLNVSPEASTSQKWATALLGIIPILAGYGLDKYRGAAIGAQAGGQAATLASQGMEQDAERERASKAQQYNAISDQLGKLDATGLDLAKSNINNQQKLQSEEALARFKKGLGGDGPAKEYPQDVQEVMAKDPKDLTPQDKLKLASNHAAYKDYWGAARSNSYVQSVGQGQARLDQNLGGDREIPGTVNVSSSPPSQEAVAIARKVKQSRDLAQSSLDELISSYDKNGQTFLGGDRAAQDANASLLWSSMRQVLQTGMRLEGKEQNLVNALAPSQYSTEGVLGVLKSQIERGDPADVARTLKSVIDKATNAKLYSYGKRLDLSDSQLGAGGTQPDAQAGGGTLKEIAGIKFRVAP